MDVHKTNLECIETMKMQKDLNADLLREKTQDRARTNESVN
jgi:hypothetical protein